ncbi:E3 ubiquitin-protein ligase SH3RF3-like isoform X2 [Liolophura sinensis]|uniref:E3 ubiquitin-protein ligase SH3RF3-like isoform X2 n=1 Tax=Liolophura sinensis TaxID=3198878 RepID=UPI003158D9DA
MDEKALNELLECSVCLDRLDHTSKVLPCQHTFCRRCLEEIISTKRELRCPECRTLVEIRVEDLPTNILLIRLLEGLKNANNPILAAHSAAKLQLQSRRHDSASPILPGVQNAVGSSGSHERQGSSSSCNQVSQPSAKALYNYDAKEQGDLAFRKGDIISLRKQIDMNWYQGELNGQSGYFPASYVQVITALPSLIPQCKALYDFDMKDENEKDCLTFHKDDIVTIIRRVDDNWIEGRRGDRIGIFPISFVELNDAAKCLINTKSSAKPSVIVTTANAAAPSHPADIVPPTVSNPGLLSVETGASKRHSLTSIATQNPPVPAHNQRRSMELVTPIVVPCSISPLSRPVRVVSPTTHAPPLSLGSSVSTSSTGQLPVSKYVSQISQTAASVSSTSTCNGSTGGRAPTTTENVSVISQNMFAATPGTLIYVAMYNYKPQKEDEVELKKGEYYTVHEKCQDGWFKGTSLKTGYSGVFPGNYVQLVRSSIPMKPVSSNVLNIRAKAPAPTSSTVMIPAAIVMSEPAPLLPPSTHKEGTVLKPTAAKPTSSSSSSGSSESHHQRTGSNPHVPVRQTGPPLMPRMGKAAVVAASQAASAGSTKSSHITNLSSVGVVKHPHAVPVSFSSSHANASSKGSNSKGVSHHSEHAVSGSGQSCKKSSSSSGGHSGHTVLAQSNPGYSNSALIVKPHAAPPPGSNVVINAPPNVLAGATGGSASNSSSPSHSSRDRDKEKKDKEKKEKLSLVKRLAPGKSKRSKSHDNETTASAAPVHVADVGISHVRSGSYPTEGSAGVAEASHHKKTGSFDSTSTHSASAKSSKPKTIMREKFRCIVPYPPQSEVELELKLGDVVFVHKKREDGWYKGTLQRTGKTGLFPGSFVEKYD